MRDSRLPTNFERLIFFVDDVTSLTERRGDGDFASDSLGGGGERRVAVLTRRVVTSLLSRLLTRALVSTSEESTLKTV